MVSVTTATGGIRAAAYPDRRRPGSRLAAQWPRPSSPAPPASSAPTSRARSSSAGDDLRVTVREGSDTRAIDDLDVEQVKCDILDRRAVRRAMKGVDRVFHAAGMTSMRPADAERLFEVNVGGARTVLEECLRAEVERVVLTSSAAALGPAARGAHRRRDPAVHRRPPGHPVRELRARARGRGACGWPRRGLPLVCVNPTVVLGPGDIHVTSTRLVRSFLLGRVPAYADGALNVVDVRDVATGQLLADARGRVGERYILGGRNFTFDRLFADLGRLSGVDPPLKVPRGLAVAAASFLQDRSRAHHAEPRRRCWPAASSGPTARPRPSASWAGRRARTRRRWRPRSPGTSSTSTTGSCARGTRSSFQYRAAGAAIAAGEEAVAGGRRLLRGLGLAPALISAAWPRSTAARLRPTSSAAAARSRAACARRDRLRRGARAVPQARPPRGRGPDRPALGAGARARRGGHPRVAPHPRVPGPHRRARGPLTPRRSWPDGGSPRRVRRPLSARARLHAGRSAWPLILMAWERWQALPDEEKERYRRQAREYAERGSKARRRRAQAARRRSRRAPPASSRAGSRAGSGPGWPASLARRPRRSRRPRASPRPGARPARPSRTSP